MKDTQKHSDTVLHSHWHGLNQKGLKNALDKVEPSYTFDGNGATFENSLGVPERLTMQQCYYSPRNVPEVIESIYIYSQMNLCTDFQSNIIGNGQK